MQILEPDPDNAGVGNKDDKLMLSKLTQIYLFYCDTVTQYTYVLNWRS